MYVVGNQLFNCSVSHYSQENVCDARHTYDLNRRKKTVVNIDAMMGPLGNHSCGKLPPLEKYLLKPGSYTFGFVISFQ